MAGEPLLAAKEAAQAVLARLRPCDVALVVAYDHEVTVLGATDEVGGVSLVAHRLAALAPGGSTNLSGGWLRGAELLTGRPAGMRRRVLLLTDGLANAGVQDPAQLTALCRRACARGVTTTTVGFGPEYDETLLAAMAEAGGGRTWYVERWEQARDVFCDELVATQTVTAQDVAVQVVPSAIARELRVLLGGTVTQAADGSWQVAIGDLPAGAARRVLIEVVAPASAVEADAQTALLLATLRVSGLVLGDDGAVERRQVTQPVVSTLSAQSTVEPAVTREWVLAALTDARTAAAAAAERGGAAEAAAVLRAAAATARDAGGDDALVAEHAADLERLAEAAMASGLDASDRKYLRQQAYHGRHSHDAQARRLARRPDGSGRG
jgi:Ca-activated chloride channel family protein